MFARFGTAHFLWWDVYIANWAKFSQWLLGIAVFRKLIEDCQCPLKHNVSIPEALPDLSLPHRPLKERRKKSSQSLLVFDCQNPATKNTDLCSVCLEAIPQNEHCAIW